MPSNDTLLDIRPLANARRGRKQRIGGYLCLGIDISDGRGFALGGGRGVGRRCRRAGCAGLMPCGQVGEVGRHRTQELFEGDQRGSLRKDKRASRT